MIYNYKHLLYIYKINFEHLLMLHLYITSALQAKKKRPKPNALSVLFGFMGRNFRVSLSDLYVEMSFYFAGACCAGACCAPAAGAACWLAPKPGVVFGFVVCVSVAAFSITLVPSVETGAT